jgi:hypothetical protein
MRPQLSNVSHRHHPSREPNLGAEHITRSFIANLESRRRGLSVDDVLVLALTLDVAPLDLLALASERDEELVLTSSVRVNSAETLRGWLVGETALPESNARLYYATALERMQAPDGQPMSAYAKAVVQERSAQIAAHYEQEATELLRRTRAQALELLADIGEAVSSGLDQDEILRRLDAIRHRVGTPPTSAE